MSLIHSADEDSLNTSSNSINTPFDPSKNPSVLTFGDEIPQVDPLDPNKVLPVNEKQVSESPAEPEKKQKFTYDSISMGLRKYLFCTFIALNMTLIGGSMVVTYAWAPDMERASINQSIVTLVLTGGGVGSFTGIFALSILTKFLGRRTNWILLLCTSSLAYISFGLVNWVKMRNNTTGIIKADESYSFLILCWLCYFFIGWSQTSITSMSNATIAKIFPDNMAFMLQLVISSLLIGQIVGPLFTAYLVTIIPVSSIMYVFSFLIFSLLILSFWALPQTQPDRKKKSEISGFQILSTYHGFSAGLNVFINGIFLRIQIIGLGVYLTGSYDLKDWEISSTSAIINSGALVISLTNAALFKILDERFLYACVGEITSGVFLLLASNFLQGSPPPYLWTIFGLMGSKFFSCQMPCLNADIGGLCQRILKKNNLSIEVRDTVSITFYFILSFALMCGSFVLSGGLEFIEFQTQLGIGGVCMILLGLNYIFASGLYKSNSIWKKKDVEDYEQEKIENDGKGPGLAEGLASNTEENGAAE